MDVQCMGKDVKELPLVTCALIDVATIFAPLDDMVDGL